MATLENTAIQDTYEGLLKITDNAALTTANKIVSDGAGTATGIKVGSGTTVEFTKLVSQTGLGNSTYFGENAGIVDDFSANRNVGIGYDSLRRCTTGFHNNIMGFQAGEDINTGNDNNAMGNQALMSTTTGDHNIGIGFQAGGTNTGGSYNVSLGRNAGNGGRASNYYNIAIGQDAHKGSGNCNYAVCVGNNAGKGNGFGHGSIAVGAGAGEGAAVSGNYSCYLGYNAGRDTDSTVVVKTNMIALGANCDGNGSNTATIGDDAITALHLEKPGAAIVLKSADGTAFSITVNNSGELVVS